MSTEPKQPAAGTPAVPDRAFAEMARIALPTVAAMTSYTLMTFTDKWLVSHIGPDPVYVGAQGNGGLVSWIPISLCQGALTIVNTYVAQNMGAGKPERGPAYAWNGIWIAVAYWAMVLLPMAIAIPYVFDAIARTPGSTSGMDPRQAAMSAQYASILLYGAFITLATRCVSQFFYGMHKPGVVLLAGFIGNVTNLLLSAVLVFGNGPAPESLGLFGRLCHDVGTALGIPPMGIAGSAIGTVIAGLVELAIPMSIFLGPKLNARFKTRAAWRPAVQPIKDILRLGWPAGATFGNEMICWGFFMVYLVSGFGPFHASAAWIAHQYMSLSFMPAVGLSVATTAVVGKYQGMGRPDLAAERAWLGVRVAMVYMGLCAAVFIAFPATLIDFFIASETPAQDRAVMVELGTRFLYATAAFQLFDAVAMVLSGALRGAGDTVFPGVMTLVLSWAVIVGGGLAMVRWFPGLESLGPWIAAATYIAVLCVALLARFLTGRWKTIKLVHDGAAAGAH